MKRTRTVKTIENDIDPAEHLGLVYLAAGKLAAKFNRPVDEFVGESYLALIAAKRTYNPAKGFRFSTHATHAIRFRAYGGIMQDRGAERVHGKGWKQRKTAELHDHHADRPHLPVADHAPDIERLAEFASRVNRYGAEVVRMRGRGMTLRQVGAAIGISRERVRQILRAVHKSVQVCWTAPMPGAVA